MLLIAGAPLLEYIIRHLVTSGVSQVFINLHYKGEIIRTHFGDGSRFGAAIHYREERTLTGTAGGLRGFADCLSDEGDFVVQYGDVLTNEPLEDMVQEHRRSGCVATILLHDRKGSNSIVEVDASGRVTRFLERPRTSLSATSTSTMAFSGLVVASPAIFDHIGPETSDLPRDVFPQLASRRLLGAHRLSRWRCAVDSEDRLEQARKDIGAGVLQ
jgi:NDP-sugar pyrophosphorylase family protein